MADLVPRSPPPSFVADTRVAYDVFAAAYAEEFVGELPERPFDRALLAAFAELVRSGADGPVADLGCGPGHIGAHLATLGVDVVGLDVSREMLRAARTAFLHLPLVQASMTGLPFADGALGGVVAYFSLIHVTTDALPGVAVELARVVRPGGQLLAAFMTGDDETLVRTEAFGHEIELAYHLRSVDAVAGALVNAGFTLHATVHRDPPPASLTGRPRGYVMAFRSDPVVGGEPDGDVGSPPCG